MFVQEMALQAPERIAALVLMDTAHGPVGIDGELLELGVSLARAGDLETIASVLESGDADVLGTPAAARLAAERPEIGERHFRNLRLLSHDMYAAMAVEITTRADRLGELSAVAVPTLVIVGEQDEPFRTPSRAMADAIRGAELVVVPDAGHCPQQEAPEAWWAAVSAFLDGLPGLDDPPG
jgi:pimeloyl-ACP methyl ester carboxylesterase